MEIRFLYLGPRGQTGPLILKFRCPPHNLRGHHFIHSAAHSMWNVHASQLGQVQNVHTTVALMNILYFIAIILTWTLVTTQTRQNQCLDPEA